YPHIPFLLALLFLDCTHHRISPSFPTRRSSDLMTLPSWSARRTRSTPSSRPEPRPSGDLPERAACGRVSRPSPPTRSSCRIGSEDRKSTRLNSSHEWISYAVFCLKKKNKNKNIS